MADTAIDTAWRDTVLWSDRGCVLHRSPRCPYVIRLVKAEASDPGHLKIWSFVDDVGGTGKPFPPEWPLCQGRYCSMPLYIEADGEIAP